MTAFEQKIQIHFRQTDMAGIVYFNQVFNIFHDVYESWVQHIFKSKKMWFSNPEWAVPIKNVQCDYKAPLLPFEEYTVKIVLTDIGTTTFRLKTEILNNSTVCAELSTVHIFLDKKTKTAMPIPKDILAQWNYKSE